MEENVKANHNNYLERIELYKKFGYDIPQERSFIIEKSKPIHGRILEIGTGKGYFTIELARQRCYFSTVDISEVEQAIARLNIEYFGLQEFVDFKIEKKDALSFPDQSFDVIFCINTLHHFLYPFQMIDEMIRIRNSQGKIIVSDFSQEGFAIVEQVLAMEGKKHDISPISLDEIEAYFLRQKFRIEKYRSKVQKILIAY